MEKELAKELIDSSVTCIGELVRHVRNMKEFSTEQFANEIGVSKGTISKWENSKMLPSLPALDKVLELGGYSFEVTEGLNMFPERQEDENVVKKVEIDLDNLFSPSADLFYEDRKLPENEARRLLNIVSAFLDGVNYE